MVQDSSREVYSNATLDTPSSEFNILSFLIESVLNQQLNTALPVRVDSCTKPGTGGAAGYVSATPLICHRGSDGRALPPVSIPKLPFFRLQCGTAAVVIDPQPGDVGLAVFAQKDCSTLQAGKTEPEVAGSFRRFDMSDGFYIGGFLGVPPETFIECDPDTKSVTVTGPLTVTVNADEKITLDAPLVEVTGRIVQTGERAESGGSSFTGGFTNTGGRITSNGIVLEEHTHTGVEAGNDSTGEPQ